MNHMAGIGTFAEKAFKFSRETKVSSYIEYLEKSYNFQISLRKSKRARRITLRICQFTGDIKITVPYAVKTIFLRQFVDENLPWIKNQIRNISPSITIQEGISIPLLGSEKKILTDSKSANHFRFTDQSLIIPKTQLTFNKQIKFVLMQIAEDYFVENCNKYAKKLGISYARIAIRDPRSRWGSCSSQRRLMFSWRLIMAPNSVSSYVAAHEVAHLIHMNHSYDFWSIVKLMCPDYPAQRTWLRKNGKNLHRFIF